MGQILTVLMLYGWCLGVVGRVFDTEKHTNIKRNAEYRRIGKYHKSLGRFKVEKARRQQVLLLWSDGIKTRHIAERLGVSERTVKRDLARLMIYIKNKRSQLMHRETEAEIAYFNSLNLKQQMQYIKEDQEQRKRIFKAKKCKALTITIDIDKAFGGRYSAVKFKPDLPVDMQEYGRITLELTAAGKKQAIARIYVGKVVRGEANLQTNQSMNQLVKATLKGLRVIEPTTETTPET
jgi:transposase